LICVIFHPEDRRDTSWPATADQDHIRLNPRILRTTGPKGIAI
jgi:hypothetical protein